MCVSVFELPTHEYDPLPLGCFGVIQPTAIERGFRNSDGVSLKAAKRKHNNNVNCGFQTWIAIRSFVRSVTKFLFVPRHGRMIAKFIFQSLISVFEFIFQPKKLFTSLFRPGNTSSPNFWKDQRHDIICATINSEFFLIWLNLAEFYDHIQRVMWERFMYTPWKRKKWTVQVCCKNYGKVRYWFGVEDCLKTLCIGDGAACFTWRSVILSSERLLKMTASSSPGKRFSHVHWVYVKLVFGLTYLPNSTQCYKLNTSTSGSTIVIG